jgi:cytochrome P450
MNETTVTGREAPRAMTFPVFGSLPAMMTLGPLEFYRREWRAKGDVIRVNFGARQGLIVVHPDAIERVLGSHRENYVKGSAYDGIRLLTGEGLLTLEGDAWRARRRLENPAFHRESIRRFVDVMGAISREAIAAWRWRIPNGGVVDIHHEMMRVTLEIVAATLFGQRLGEDAGDESGLAFASALSLVSERGNSVVQLPLHVPTPSNVRFRRSLETLDRQVYSVISRARAEPPGSEKVPTLLSMLLAARDADTHEGLSDKDLRNEVITLFLAGHETTALLMTWGFVLLAREPEVVRRMRDEITRVCGDRLPTSEDVTQLVYVRQVIDEILRFRSPVWSTARDAAGPDVIQGFRVEQGDLVMPLIYLTHRHPEFWDKPDVFDPDRFTPERSKGRHHWAYLPFSLGPRICIGNIFSLTEAAVLFATLLQQVEWSMAGPSDVQMDPSITLRPKGAVPVRIRWRQ